MLFVRNTQQQMRTFGLMVIMTISPKSERRKKTNVSGASGDNGTGPTASSDESAENVKVQMAVSQQRLASVQQGPSKGH